MKRIINTFIILSVIYIFSADPASSKINNIAMIESFSGNIVITQNNSQVIPAKYLYLTSGCHVVIPQGARLTIIMYTGKKINFTDPSEFEISNNELILIKGPETDYIAKNTSRIHTGGTRNITDPDETPANMENDIKEIDEKISDPLMRILAKVDYYQKNNMINKSNEEFKKYLKLKAELEKTE